MKVLQLKVRRLVMFMETSGECAVYLDKEVSCVTDTSYNLGQKSLRQCCSIHIFMSLLGSLLKQCILFEIFLQFSLPHPIQSGNSEKKSGCTRSTLFVG